MADGIKVIWDTVQFRGLDLNFTARVDGSERRFNIKRYRLPQPAPGSLPAAVLAFNLDALAPVLRHLARYDGPDVLIID